MLLEQTDLLPLRQELASRHVRILIADDNLTNRRLLGSWLQDYVQLDSVEDGEQVVTRCNSILFDAILIDLHMPRLDGLMATLHVRQKSLLNQNTPVILISANSNDFHEIDLKKFGIQARLTKPIDERSLIQSLLTVLDNNCHKAIDWSMCVNKMSGNVAFAREYLIQFIEELHLARQDLLEYLHHHDCSLLEESAHKLHGACCFFGAPQLQESVAKLESTAKHSLNQDELRNQLSVCIEHIDLVLHESFKFDTTTQTKEKRDNA
jgi:two-component system sensor histidine kinase BarA